MAKGPREIIQGRLQSSIEAVEKVQGYLIECGEINREHHPDITNQYEVLYSYFEQGKQLLEAMKATY